MAVCSKIIEAILLQNDRSITKSLRDSFSSSEIPVSTVNFIISIDIIELYDISVDAAHILHDLHEIEMSIKKSLESLTGDFFRRMGFTSIPFLSQMLTVNLNISPVFCMIDKFAYSFPEITGYLTGHLTSKPARRFLNPIKMCTGILSFIKKEVAQHNQTFECTNIPCSNKTVCICHNDAFFLIDTEEKTITKTVENKGCLRCGSILSKTHSLIRYEYVYALSISDTDDIHIRDRFITVKSVYNLAEVFAISNIKDGGIPRNEELLTLHGYIERDWSATGALFSSIQILLKLVSYKNFK